MLGILFGVFFPSLGLEWCLVCRPSGPDPCCATMFAVPSFSFSGCSVFSSAPFFSLSFSLSLSLSGAGETQTFSGVWDSPCVLFIVAADSPSSTRTPCSTTTPRSGSRACLFFFFLRRRRSRVWWWLFSVCLVSVVWGCVCRVLVFASVLVGCCMHM